MLLFLRASVARRKTVKSIRSCGAIRMRLSTAALRSLCVWSSGSLSSVRRSMERVRQGGGHHARQQILLSPPFYHASAVRHLNPRDRTPFEFVGAALVVARGVYS